ncbi:MAG: hypothetical protein R3C03_00995 [Pirellulaceae bacterium]
MRQLLLLTVVALLSGCGSSNDDSETTSSLVTPSNPNWLLPAGEHEIADARPPAAFLVSIGGFSGQSFKLELDDDGKLMYRQNPDGFTEWGGTSEEVNVTEDMWIEFRDRLNDAEVWKWRRRYDDPKIADGTVWKLKIGYSNQSIVSSGSNAYPSKRQFNMFLNAVSALAGGRPFE